ncbi:hypothetical protein MMC25_001198 [Agyrium rufum]|nr:hypothetical protein [Agyrium rufum]
MAIIIRVPCSSANIGPGFDVIGLALSMYLTVKVTTSEASLPPSSLNCSLTYEGDGADGVPLDTQINLITRCALYVLRCHGIHEFPHPIHVHVNNPIPLGRGLGSSGAAVVAGILLGDLAGDLKLPKHRVLDYCLMIERHPDNVAAALYGGFVGTYLRELDAQDMARVEIPLSEVLPEPAGGVDTGLMPPTPPEGIGHFIKFKWAKEVKAIAIVPNFEVKTADARGVLPQTYTRSDVIFNLQRLALLTTALGQSPPDPDLIYQAMQDKVHQPYRKNLIPGLPQVLDSLSPTTHPGLLGICLSGAGPTILALATENFQQIAESIVEVLGRFEVEGKKVECTWEVLQPAEDGATVTRS